MRFSVIAPARHFPALRRDRRQWSMDELLDAALARTEAS